VSVLLQSLSLHIETKKHPQTSKRTVVVAGGATGFVIAAGVVVAGGGGGGLVVGTGTGDTAGAELPLGLHLPQEEWQLPGTAAQSSFPSLARSAHVLELGVPAGATSLQHLPQERSQADEIEEHAPAAATASHEGKPLEAGGAALEHMPQAPKVQL